MGDHRSRKGRTGNVCPDQYVQFYPEHLHSKISGKEIQDALAGEKSEIGWGNQIRSYVLQPYQLVKDLRTDYETGNVNAVLDGDLDPFVEAYLKSSNENK